MKYNPKMPHQVRQTISGRRVTTRFPSEKSAKAYADAVGGKIVKPATSFGAALFASLHGGRND